MLAGGAATPPHADLAVEVISEALVLGAEVLGDLALLAQRAQQLVLLLRELVYVLVQLRKPGKSSSRRAQHIW